MQDVLTFSTQAASRFLRGDDETRRMDRPNRQFDLSVSGSY